MLAIYSRFRRNLKRFSTAQGGNVAITFGIATLPIICAVGAAVDFSHANSVKAAMQSALDSTALMVSRDAAELSDSALTAKANSYFKALFTRPEATNVTVAATYSSSAGSQVLVTGSAKVPTSIMGVMGYNQITINGSATAKWGTERLRVALALDNTGSMADDGKMTELKSATKALLKQLKGAVTNDGDVLVSIIPFAKDVNIGKANYKAKYIDWTDWNNNNGSCSKSGWGTGTSVGCLLALGTWTRDSHKTWNGCVVDRGDKLLPTLLNTDILALPIDLLQLGTMYSAEQYSDCPTAMLTLGTDWDGMDTLVDNMKPAGNTNQGIGLFHAWMSLVGGGPQPAPPPEDPNYKYSKVIILMSDGLNTQNRWYSKQSQVDDRQKLACANAKAAGITIYSVQVNTGGDPTQDVMKNCASSSDKFWEIKTAGDIGSVFNEIGTNLTKLRVAK
jgi:Flp pilus assembly protein TadG